jgi:hypothetical protein
LEDHFAGMVPLFDEDQELLAVINERLQRLTELLGPVDAEPPVDAAKRLVRALTSGNG